MHTVADKAFYGCKDIAIEIKGTLRSIGEYSFTDCTRLASITLGEPITSIPFCAFLGCSSLERIVLPSSLTTITENAFEACESLVYVVAPASLTAVESGAFRECTSLSAVYYSGGEADFDKIDIAPSYNSAIIEANLLIYSEAQPEDDGIYWHYDERGNIRLWK